MTEKPRTLSLVVPTYNAQDLAERVLEAVPALERAAAGCGFRLVEALFVDDASEVPLKLPRSAGTGCRVAVLRNSRNRGKGYSVRRGALAAKGGWALMSDVDMSAPLTEFPKLAERADAWMACGSRHGRPGSPLGRRVLSRIFAVCVRLAGVKTVRDTQCGFKLFRMDAMRPVFAAQETERFAFDVELVKRVEKLGGTAAETPVEWRGGSRSSLSIVRDAPRMLWDLLRVRFV